MAVDTDFASLFDKMKVQEDPWVPPRNWESIPTESGSSRINTAYSSSQGLPLYHTSALSEASLVRLALNALQGIESSLLSIDKLCAIFSSDPADRTCHRIPSVWNQSLSTLALGKLLRSFGRSGFEVFLLRKFVEYFSNFYDAENLEGNKQPESDHKEYHSHIDREGGRYSQESLVNQAFSLAVGKVLEGYICALDSISSSVSFRRLSTHDVFSSSSSVRTGCLSSVGYSEFTLLEVYLHTKGLRSQIEALGCICNVHDVACRFSVSPFKDLDNETKFSTFPRGGNLLTYLYMQLKVADPLHCSLLKLLFLRSCEPYFGFIRSWIFKAVISDPFNEFIVAKADNLRSESLQNTGVLAEFPSATIRDGVAVPCFLKDLLVPLFRAGQQLEVIMKLLELCDDISRWNQTCEEFLPYCSRMPDDHLPHASPLTFSKESLKNMVFERRNHYKLMMEKLEKRLTNIEFKYHQVFPHRTLPISVYNSRKSAAVSVDVDGRPLSSSTKKRNKSLPIGSVNFDTSFPKTGVLSVEERFDISECSSLDSSEGEEEDQAEMVIECPHDAVDQEQRLLSALRFHSRTSFDISSAKPSDNAMLSIMESVSCELSGKAVLPGCLWPEGRLINLNDSSLGLYRNLPFMTEAEDPSVRPDISWPLHGIVQNPFSVGRGNIDNRCLCDSGCYLNLSNTDLDAQAKHTSCCTDLILTKNHLVLEAASLDPNLEGNTLSSKSWKVKYHPNFLSANPKVINNSLIPSRNKLGERSFAEQIPFLDFRSVKDPFMVYVARSALNPNSNEEKHSVPADSAALLMSNPYDKEGHTGDEVSVDNHKSSYVYSPTGLGDSHKEDGVSPNMYGGSGWEILLGSSSNAANVNARENRMNATAIFEMPLDFVIEKCILEEIRLQYTYVSKLTIKLLEEGFFLQEHLHALRRYHLMEAADWADLFIMSLQHHKWYATETDKRISEIQGLLELSVQRSSCERDHNKDRLFVYVKEHGPFSLPKFATGIHSFDLLGLGYRVDWPVSIVLTPGALKIYAEIFSFLVQVKLALSSLSEVWCSFKELSNLINQNRNSAIHALEACHFNILMKLRQQVYHFVTTLQQYVQSQLSHVSWCRFLHSLKHKVKDLLDLESVHKDYLTDSMCICFLSEEMLPVANMIQSILQCAVDFRSCLVPSTLEAELDTNLQTEVSTINISQVLSVKQLFDKNLKELYLCYLKSPKNVEFGLPRFWEYLNYNDHYSEAIGKEMSRYIFSI